MTPRKRIRLGWPLGLIITASVALAPLPAHAQQFQLGLQYPGFGGQGSAAQLQAAAAATQTIDGSVLRVAVPWAKIAPAGTDVPAGFRPSDPSDSHYRWSVLDEAVRWAAEHHMRVLAQILDAPVWAQGPGPQKPYVSPGAWDPNSTQFAAFIHAAAVRYSGSYPDPLTSGATLPRVNYWEPWNEPNIPGYLSAPDPVSAYRALLDRAYGVLKAVHRDNVVVLGGLAPVSPVPGSIPPLDFGAKVLCLHRTGQRFSADRSCRQRAEFDVFGMHPYSLAATPTKHAYKPGDVLVGDMSEVSALVRASNHLHTALPRAGHRIWVTEFAWPTAPPNGQLGDPVRTAARYVAYSMYEMFRSDVSLVVWQSLVDEPLSALPGAGLYWNSGQPKLTLEAFAFPVVASVAGGHGLVWGRAPVSRRVQVVIQRAASGRWRRVVGLRTSRDGVFSARFPARTNGRYRAYVVGGQTSLAYNSRPIPPKRTHLLTGS